MDDFNIKQIMPLPDDIMAVYKVHTEDGEQWEDVGNFVPFLFIADYHEHDTDVRMGSYDTDGGFGITNSRWDGDYMLLIPKYKCPKCGNRMTVKPFREVEEAEYYCPICGCGR